jgi:hypothetical protein
MVIIPFFIMTIDAEGEEGGIDVVADFTALYILCNID